jgi:hypothetical protein
LKNKNKKTEAAKGFASLKIMKLTEIWEESISDVKKTSNDLDWRPDTEGYPSYHDKCEKRLGLTMILLVLGSLNYSGTHYIM